MARTPAAFFEKKLLQPFLQVATFSGWSCSQFPGAVHLGKLGL
jgi:hypothetical protein